MDSDFLSVNKLVEEYPKASSIVLFIDGGVKLQSKCGAYYTFPILMKAGKDFVTPDFPFSLKKSIADKIKQDTFYAIQIDCTTPKKYVDDDGIEHTYYPTRLMNVASKLISKLRSVQASKMETFDEDIPDEF